MYDCDDNNAQANPAAEEILYNEIDENCDGIDQGCTSYTKAYPSQNVHDDQRTPLVRISDNQFVFFTNQGSSSKLIMLDRHGYEKWAKDIDGSIINLRSNGSEIFLHQVVNGQFFNRILDTSGNQTHYFPSSSVFLDDNYIVLDDFATCLTIGGSLGYFAKSNIYNREEELNITRNGVIPGGLKLYDGNYLTYVNIPYTCNIPGSQQLSTSNSNYLDLNTSPGSGSFFDYHMDPLQVNAELFPIDNNQDNQDYFIFRDDLYLYRNGTISKKAIEQNVIDANVFDDDVYILKSGNILKAYDSTISLPFTDVISFTQVSKNKFLFLDRVSPDSIAVRRLYIEDDSVCESIYPTIDTSLCSMAIFGSDTIFENSVYFSESESIIYNVEISNPIVFEDVFFCEGYTYNSHGLDITEPGNYDISVLTNGCDSLYRVQASYLSNRVIDTTINIACLVDGMFEGFEINDIGTYNFIIPDSNICDLELNVNAVSEATIIETPIVLNICASQENLVYRDSVYMLDINTDNVSDTIQQTYFSTSNGCDSLFYIEIIVLPIVQVEKSYNLGDNVESEEGIFSDFIFTSDTTFIASDCDSFTYVYEFYENYNTWTIPIDNALKFGINNNSSIIVSTDDNSCLGYEEDELVWEKNITNKFAVNPDWPASQIRINSGQAYYLGDDYRVYSIDFPQGEINNEGIDLTSNFSSSKYINWDLHYDGTTVKTAITYIDTIAFNGNPGQAHYENHHSLRLTVDENVLDTFIYNEYFAISPLVMESFDDTGVYHIRPNGRSVIYGSTLQGYSNLDNTVPPVIAYDEEHNLICQNSLELTCHTDTESLLRWNNAIWINFDTPDIANSLEIHDSLLILNNSLMYSTVDGTYLGFINPTRLDSIIDIAFTDDSQVVLQGFQGDQQFIIKDEWFPDFVEYVEVIYNDELFGMPLLNDTIIYNMEPFNLGEINKKYVVSVIVVDEDQDGFTNDVDCDDTNPDINPDAVDIADNGIDEDCDGVDEITSNVFDNEKNIPKFYPNPTSGTINIQSVIESNYNLELLDINGKKLEYWMNLKGNFLLELNDRPNGIYYLKYTSSELGAPYLTKVLKI